MTGSHLHRGLGVGPSLLHPGRAQAWWALAGGRLAWWDGQRSWEERGDHVVVARAPFDPHPSPAVRVWRDHELLFREREGRIRAIATLRTRARIAHGPDGAVAVGDGNRWTRGATGTTDVMPLATPLPVTPWGIRFSADGRRLAGPDEDGGTRIVDLWSGRDVARHPGALPVDGDGGLLHDDGHLVAAGVARAGIREATAVRHGDLLAGPGGVVWDLAAGRPCFAEPIVPLGAVVPDDAGPWLAIAWDTGRGAWFDPRTGAVGERVVVPLAPSDSVAGGARVGGDAIVWTSEGRAFVIGRDARPIDALPAEPERVRAGPGFAIDRRGLHTDAWDVDAPVTEGAAVGGRIWAWSDDGLLVAVPSGPH